MFADSHIFDAFALVNFLLCSATNNPKADPTVSSKGAAKGSSSAVMQQNCSRHFVSTLRILRPTVIIVQGIGVRNWMRQFLKWPLANDVIQKLAIDGELVDVFTFVHPSASGEYGWWGNSPNSNYLLTVVRPTIQEYLRLH